MKLLVGLGNPGLEYQNTRHNAGAMLVSFFNRMWQGSGWTMSKKFMSLMSEVQVASGSKQCTEGKKTQRETARERKGAEERKEKWLLALPQTYMNLSGTAVVAVANFYKLAPVDMIIAYDDLDLELGTFKIDHKGPKAHNGVNDIKQKLGSEEMLQLRVGIDARGGERVIPSVDYVLTNFSEAQREKLEMVFEAATAELMQLS
jgi:PTH1 family peptidyl-tRNA hydrolase